jgi:uncharacterized integral membrane protein
MVTKMQGRVLSYNKQAIQTLSRLVTGVLLLLLLLLLLLQLQLKIQ